jgi:hypothetical protein
LVHKHLQSSDWRILSSHAESTTAIYVCKFQDVASHGCINYECSSCFLALPLFPTTKYSLWLCVPYFFTCPSCLLVSCNLYPTGRKLLCVIKALAFRRVQTLQVPLSQSICNHLIRLNTFLLFEASVEVSNKSKFYRVGLSTPRPTSNLEDQGISFCLGHHL